jgi:hypothetical protein
LNAQKHASHPAHQELYREMAIKWLAFAAEAESEEGEVSLVLLLWEYVSLPPVGPNRRAQEGERAAASAAAEAKRKAIAEARKIVAGDADYTDKFAIWIS